MAARPLRRCTNPGGSRTVHCHLLCSALHDAIVAEWFSQRDSIPPAAESGDAEVLCCMLALAAEGTLLLERRLGTLRRRMRGQGLTPPPLPPELSHIDDQRRPPPVDLRREGKI